MRGNAQGPIAGFTALHVQSYAIRYQGKQCQATLPIAWLNLELLRPDPTSCQNKSIEHDHPCLSGKSLVVRVATATHLEYRCEGAILDRVPRGVRWVIGDPSLTTC